MTGSRRIKIVILVDRIAGIAFTYNTASRRRIGTYHQTSRETSDDSIHRAIIQADQSTDILASADIANSISIGDVAAVNPDQATDIHCRCAADITAGIAQRNTAAVNPDQAANICFASD